MSLLHDAKAYLKKEWRALLLLVALPLLIIGMILAALNWAIHVKPISIPEPGAEQPHYISDLPKGSHLVEYLGNSWNIVEFRGNKYLYNHLHHYIAPYNAPPPNQTASQ